MTPNTRLIAFINAAHGFTHYSLLILPTAVLAMAVPDGRFGDAYGPILALATGMFVLYGLFSLPQGWIAQRVGRPALMTLFFFGTGLSMAATALAGSPVMLAITLAATGLFAAIYHPIGTAMLVDAAGDKPGRAIGVNGVFGNLGVALAPMMTALLANAGRLARRLPAAGPRLRRARSRVAATAGCPRPSCDRERGRFPTSRAIWCAAR